MAALLWPAPPAAGIGLAGTRSGGPAASLTRDRLPVRFEANWGQLDPSVRYAGHGGSMSVALERGGAVLSVPGSAAARRGAARPPATVRITLAGSDPNAEITGEEPLAGHANYFRGNDRSRWITGVPSFSQVRYRGVYPGIDMIYHGNDGQLEYDFELQPGADPGRIQLSFAGASGLSIDGDGNLAVTAGDVTLRHHRPELRQPSGGSTRSVPGRFNREGLREVGFWVGVHDPRLPLVIDPVVSYASYFGGSAADAATSVAVDPAGNIYMAGVTASADLPSTASRRYGGMDDAFVAKVDPTRSGTDSLIYATYLGGSGDDRALGAAVDSSGAAYITGRTCSSDFPTTSGAFQTRLAAPGAASGSDAGCDAFVAKLTPTGSGLAFSTYLGGNDEEDQRGNSDSGLPVGAIAVDTNSHPFVTGETCSTDFPTTSTSYRPASPGGCHAFVTELKDDGTHLIYSTYLGGTNGPDSAVGISLDSSGRAYVAGQTCSKDFPTTRGAYQPGYRGDSQCGTTSAGDAFISRLSADGSTLEASTLLGGSGGDSAGGIALEASGVGPSRVHVAGLTCSADFPTTRAAVIASYSGGVCGAGFAGDAFVTSLDADLTTLEYSTFLQESGSNDRSGPVTGGAISLSSKGSAVVAGQTCSPTWPIARAPQPDYGGSCDAFVTELDPTGSTVDFSTYLGGGAADAATAIALDSSDNIVVAGNTRSSDFPWVGAYQGDASGGFDAFVAEIHAALPPGPLVTGVSPRGGPDTGGAAVTITGPGVGAATAVRFGDSPAQNLRSASADSVVAITPAHADGRVVVTVEASSGVTPPSLSAEYTFGKGAWSPAGRLPPDLFPGPLYGHTATLLRDGRVLILGGCLGSQDRPCQGLNTAAALYRPGSGTWTGAQSPHIPRFGHTASLLSNSMVLVVGGCDGSNLGGCNPLQEAELYDPDHDVWTAAPTPLFSHGLHTATVLPDGSAVVAGGVTSAGGSDVKPNSELYDPGLRQWLPTGPLTNGRDQAVATVIPIGPPGACGLRCGHPLVVGGLSPLASYFFPTLLPFVAPPEVFDPTSRSWSQVASPAPLAAFQALVPLDDGTVLQAGGLTSPSDETTATTSSQLYSPAAVDSSAWTSTGVLGAARFGVASSPLPNGRALVAGGRTPSATGTAEVYDAQRRSWATAGSMARGRAAAGAVNSGGTLLVPGPSATLLSSDPHTFSADPAICGTACGRVLVVGGAADNSAEIYTPQPSVTKVAVNQGPAGGGTAVTVTGGGFTNGPTTVSVGGVDIPCTTAPAATQMPAEAASCSIVSYSQLSVVTPPHARGAVDIVVSTAGGASDQGAADLFTYVCDTVQPAAPGQVTYPAGRYSLVAGPQGAVVPSDSSLYGWFDQSSGRYSKLARGQATSAGHGYWAYFRCPEVVTLKAASAPATGSPAGSISFPLHAGRASMVGNPSAREPAIVSGFDVAARWVPDLNNGAGGYQMYPSSSPQTLGVGEGLWVLSYRDTTITIAT